MDIVPGIAQGCGDLDSFVSLIVISHCNCQGSAAAAVVAACTAAGTLGRLFMLLHSLALQKLHCLVL